MRSLFRKMHKGEKGFTLVELLVVFTLLALLAAIVIPNVATFVEFGETQAAATELSIIQTAMDSMMAHNQLSTVAATGPTNDMSAFPTGNPLYPDYLRFDTSSENYTCSTSGLVTQTIID